MPDQHGHFKGITVPALPWHEPPELPCPHAGVCQTCDCADEDDVCFPHERTAAEQ